MNFKDQELVELTLSEISAVAGGVDIPVNNPPGIAVTRNDNEPINNPVGL